MPKCTATKTKRKAREPQRITVPTRPRGRPTPKADAAYWREVEKFAGWILKIASSLDFRPSSRGWCYTLETEVGIGKDQFDACQNLINDCRKRGLLPLDICSEDGRRQFYDVERIDDCDPREFALQQLAGTYSLADEYAPFSFWEDKPYYVQMVVEKIDLRELFRPITAGFRVPIANAAGWSDLHIRASMMTRFRDWEVRGKTPVLLYCGDFDPAGVRISDALMENMQDMQHAVGWDPSATIIDRFGLNRDFIEDNGLSWIDNLTTGGQRGKNNLADPNHRDHWQDYVQNWLREVGVRKVEANALVVRPDAGRELCRQAITKYVAPDAPAEYLRAITPYQDHVREAFAELVPSAPWE